MILKILTFFLAGILILTVANNGAVFGADVLSPRQQMKSGVAPEDVVCREGLTLILRATSNSAACVSSDTSIKLVDNGWAEKILKEITTIKSEIKSLGEVKTVHIVEHTSTKPPSIQPGVKSYSYVFQACAGPNPLLSPEVLVMSDSESKSVKLSEKMTPNSCQTSSTKISAADKNSIKAVLLNKGDLNKLIQTLEEKVTDLRAQLDVEKKNLSQLASSDPETTENYKSNAAELTDKIVELRNELNLARDELNRNKYLLFVSPPEKLDPSSFELVTSAITEKPLPVVSDKPQVNKVTIVKQTSETKTLDLTPRVSSYSFVFQACAGNEDIKFPEVIVKSDSESKSVKISENLPANSCKQTSTIIKAGSADTIYGVLVTVGGKTAIVNELQEKVSDLQSQLAIEKKNLVTLSKQDTDSVDFKQKMSELTDKIIELRNELNMARSDLQQILYMIHE